MVLKKLSGFHVHIILEFLVLLHDGKCSERKQKDSATYQTSSLIISCNQLVCIAEENSYLNSHKPLGGFLFSYFRLRKKINSLMWVGCEVFTFLVFSKCNQLSKSNIQCNYHILTR